MTLLGLQTLNFLVFCLFYTNCSGFYNDVCKNADADFFLSAQTICPQKRQRFEAEDAKHVCFNNVHVYKKSLIHLLSYIKQEKAEGDSFTVKYQCMFWQKDKQSIGYYSVQHVDVSHHNL